MSKVFLSEDEFQKALEEVAERTADKVLSRALPKLIKEATRKEYLTVTDLQELTGWSRRTIQYLRDSRQIPFHQHGRRVLFKTDEIEDYIAKVKVKARDQK